MIKEISEWLDSMGVKDYSIDRDTFEIDVKNDVYLNGYYDYFDGNGIITMFDGGRLPSFIRFRKINGDFFISRNNLTTLEGCPKVVYGRFECSSNNLKSLRFCPEYVSRYIDFSYNEIEDFSTGNNMDVHTYTKYFFMYGNKKKISEKKIKNEIMKYFDIREEDIHL